MSGPQWAREMVFEFPPALLILGFAPGKIDDVLGERTHGGLRNFQMPNGLPGSGDLTGETYAALWVRAFA